MATYQEKIAIAEAEIQQLQNRAKAYKQKLKAQQSKERTHRICQRGGYIEKVLKDTIPLSDELFREFIDRTLTTKFSVGVLDELKTKQETRTAATCAVVYDSSGAETAENTETAALQGVTSANATQGKPNQQSGMSAVGNPPEAERAASRLA